MARTDTLSNFLTDVADSIRNKKGTTGLIQASDFDTEIASIESGGSSGDAELEASFISSIDSSLGSNCTKLPSGLTSIGKNAFYQCTNLALTSLPDGITSIKDYAFYYCSNLALTSLPDGLTSIGKNAFYQCTNLALTSLPESVTEINNSAFQYCKAIQTMNIPSSITRIVGSLFYGCSELTNISINGDVTSISSSAFYNCVKLTKVVFTNVTNIPTLSSTNVFTNTLIATGTGYIYFPDELVDTAKSSTNWSTYADQIKGLSELV